MSSAAPQKEKTHWQRYRIYYISAAIAVSLLVLILLLYFYPSQETAVSHPVLAIARPAPGASLVATLRTNALHGSRDEAITFEAARAPGTRIEEMTVCVDAPEFIPDPASGCTQVKVFNKGNIASPPVPATIRLTPKESSGTFRILVTASWVRYVPRAKSPAAVSGKAEPAAKSCIADTDDCYPLVERVEMTMGPVDLGVNKLSQFASRFSRFLRDLTLPIILLVLANWFTRESSKRDRRLKDRESEQEEEREIARILLPKVMRLGGRYYLPMTLNASSYVQASASGPAKAKELAFNMASFFLIARTLKEREGGIFFKDFDAEQIFKVSYSNIRERFVAAVGGEDQFTACLNHLQARVPTGEKRWPRVTDGPVVALKEWTDLEAWFAKIGKQPFDAIRYLFNILAATMRYETNAPFAFWYSNSKDENLFRVDDDNIAAPPDEEFGTLDSTRLAEFKKLLASYREGREKRAK